MKTSVSFHNSYGPWALVTGASSGIGASFATQLAKQGFNLIMVARRRDKLEQLAQVFNRDHGTRCELMAENLADGDSIERILSRAALYDVGLLVSNAGFGLKGEFCSHSTQQLETMLNVNVRAPMLLIHGLLPQLRKRSQSGIIITGSQEGESPFPWSSAYAGSKAFVHNFALSLYGELDTTGVDLMVLAPGSTDTEALTRQGFRPETLPGLMHPDIVAAQSIKRLGKTPLHIPGWHNRVAVWIMRHLPLRARIALAGKGMLAALKKGQPDANPSA